MSFCRVTGCVMTEDRLHVTDRGLQVAGRRGLECDPPVAISAVRFHSFPQSDMWNHPTRFSVDVMTPSNLEWTEVLAGQEGKAASWNPLKVKKLSRGGNAAVSSPCKRDRAPISTEMVLPRGVASYQDGLNGGGKRRFGHSDSAAGRSDGGGTRIKSTFASAETSTLKKEEKEPEKTPRFSARTGALFR